jgi:hypothetical protein
VTGREEAALEAALLRSLEAEVLGSPRRRTALETDPELRVAEVPLPWPDDLPAPSRPPADPEPEDEVSRHG